MDEIVVGVDGSDHSRMALRWAAGVARAADVPVRAVQSWVHPHLALLPTAPVPLSVDAMDDQTQGATTEIVTEVLGSTDGVTVETLRGPAAGALLERVDAGSVLVLGSRGLRGFSGLLLGSVSQECVEYASCPVVVVRTDRLVGEGDVILVGKDGSEGAQRALRWAHALAGATGATLRATYAWEAAMSERPPRVGERLRTRAADEVASWTEPVGDEIDVETDEVEGDPRAVLVATATGVGPALTVVGRRGAGGLRSLRLGSTATTSSATAPPTSPSSPPPPTTSSRGPAAPPADRGPRRSRYRWRPPDGPIRPDNPETPSPAGMCGSGCGRRAERA